MLNIAANTMPMAMELVTYGKKKIVCKSFCRGLMELSATAISRARMVEIGTVVTQSRIVFFRHCRKRLYSRTFTKLPIPNVNVTPRAASRLL